MIQEVHSRIYIYIYMGKNKNTNSKRHMHLSVYSSTMYNSQGKKTTKCPLTDN